MKLSHLLSSAVVALPLVGAYLVSPDGTAAPGTTSACSEWVQDSYSLTCAIIERFYGMTEAQFEEWNPSVTQLGSGCTLISGLYYCVQINYSTMSTLPTGLPITSTSTTLSTSTTTSSVLTNSKTSSTSTTESSVTPTTTSSGSGTTTPIWLLVVTGAIISLPPLV
ncbi:hypothetical protein B0O99DRAFT_738710 [Bisporella sp. PMI_857]|nr:hypothetical protein B0O99DRAFT_738710 [Bisporella sp. PMI_857]